MNNPYGIIVSSQKGGVGKTTVAVNLSVVLREYGYRILLIDADYSNPSVGFHLGLEEANIGVRAVLEGRAPLKNAIAIHNTTGLHVLPGEISGKVFKTQMPNIYALYSMLKDAKYDFIISDMPPGAIPLETFNRFQGQEGLEILILLTPEMSACASALRLARVYDKLRIRHSFVANRVRGKRYELSIDEIEDVIGDRLTAALPEDENVPISVAQHIPVAILRRKSPFSKAVYEMGRRYARRGEGEAYPEAHEGSGFWALLRRIFGFWNR